jgi:hypothetical protein
MYRRDGRVTLSVVGAALVAVCLAVSIGSSRPGVRPAPTAGDQLAPLVAVPAHYIALTPRAKQALIELEHVLPPTAYGGVGLLGPNHLVIMETPATSRPALVAALRQARSAGVIVSERPAQHSLADLKRLVDKVFTQAPGSVAPHITGAGVDVPANRVQVFVEQVTATDQRLMAFAFPSMVELTVMPRPRLWLASL